MPEEELSFLRVARADELADGGTKLVWIGRRPIVIARAGRDLYALHGLCSHQGNPLEGGAVWKGTLECPWHHFQYNLATGENVYPKRVYPLDAQPHLRRQVRSLRTYSVRERDGYIEVGVRTVARTRGHRGQSSREEGGQGGGRPLT